MRLARTVFAAGLFGVARAAATVAGAALLGAVLVLPEARR